MALAAGLVYGGRCILVSGLSTVLKGIAKNKVSEWSIAFCRGCSGDIVAT